jgi:hypothetical protein
VLEPKRENLRRGFCLRVIFLSLGLTLLDRAVLCAGVVVGEGARFFFGGVAIATSLTLVIQTRHSVPGIRVILRRILFV